MGCFGDEAYRHVAFTVGGAPVPHSSLLEPPGDQMFRENKTQWWLSK